MCIFKEIIDKMVNCGIEIHNSNVTHMYNDRLPHMYSEDCYKLNINPKNKLSIEQAKKITALFCNHEDYYNSFDNVKNWVSYLEFQIPIYSTVRPYKNGELYGRIIVEFYLKKYISDKRKILIQKLIM